MSPQEEKENSYVKNLIIENSKLHQEVLILGKKSSSSAGVQGLNLATLITELEGRNNQKLVDIKSFVTNTYKFTIEGKTRFIKHVSEQLNVMFGCEVTIYWMKSGFKEVDKIKGIDSLRSNMEKVSGNDDIFNIYQDLNLEDITVKKELTSYEKSNSMVGKESVGCYLINSFRQLQGFIFFNSTVLIDADMLDIITSIVSSAALNTFLVEQLAAKIASVSQETLTDPLTGINNVKKMKIDIENKSVEGAVMIDIDMFKGVNDTYGYPTGDKVLIELANSLALTFSSDSDYSVYRQGGDEFVIFTSEKDHEKVQTKLFEFIHDFEDKDIDGLKCTISLGYSFQSCDTCLCLNWANYYLHKGKKQGRHAYIKGECGKKPIKIEEEKRDYSEKS